MINRISDLVARLDQTEPGQESAVHMRKSNGHKPLFNVRTVWISDVHLGSHKCQAESLLDFLEHLRCEHLYLVGDIVDVIALKRSVHWPETHTQVLRKIIDMRCAGTRVTYIPGNHDDPLRSFVGRRFGGISLKSQVVHKTREGLKLLVLHGDQLDTNVQCSRLLRHFGSRAYDAIMHLNTYMNRVRAAFGMPYWSLATQLKRRVGRAVEYMQAFEQGIAALAHQADVDGVVCGHIHQPALKSVDGKIYCNDGDWVESCSALIEYHEGTLELVHWQDYLQQSAQPVAATADSEAA